MKKFKASNSKTLVEQIGRNILKYRTVRGLTQSQLASLICENLNSSEQLSKLSISSYERGLRCPPVPTLIALASIFEISLDELVGIFTVNNRGEYSSKTNRTSDDHSILIQPSEYPLFDKKPVWMEKHDNSVDSCWGILDYKGHDENIYFICTKGVMKVDTSVNLFVSNTVDAIDIDGKSLKKLSFSAIRNAETVYCISTSKDLYVKSLYTGYYHNDPQHMIIINNANGLALPYSGIGISYQAFA